MRRVTLPLGALAAIALLVGGIGIAVDAGSKLFGGVRIGETRTPVPGARDAQLDSGRYTLFYEVDESSVESDGSGDSDVDVPPLEVTIRRGGDGPPLELEDYGGSFDVTGGGRAATAVRSVRVPESGRYRIRATSRRGAGSPAVVLGRPVLARILRLVVGIAAAFAGLALGALVVASALALRARGRGEG